MQDFNFQECETLLNQYRIPPSKELVHYIQLLLDWNEKINLTGAKDLKTLVIKHIADAWGAYLAINKEMSTHVYDVGSGGGLPGIPLCIFSAVTKTTLVERTLKKAKALNDMIEKLALSKRCQTLCVPFENIQTINKFTHFWFRGFLPGPKLATYLSHFFPGARLGRLVLMKGPSWHAEKEALLKMYSLKKTWKIRFLESKEIPYELPEDSGKRFLILV